MSQEYFKRNTAAVADYVNALKENACKSGTFDSASAQDFVSQTINQDTGVKVPEELQMVYDDAGKKSPQIVKAILDGLNSYKYEHGVDAPADVVEQAIHAAYSTTPMAGEKYHSFDSALATASSNHAANLSLQPNRAVVAILTTLTEAIPFAHYLPADIASNEARLAILSHVAGSTYGGYNQNDLLDGVASGEPYISSSRVHTANPQASTGKVDGKLTQKQTDGDHCDQDGTAVKLLRGRTIVYINGRIAAKEVDSTGSGTSTVSGKINISGVDYAIGGTINTDTGEFNLTTTPALPTTVPVVVEGFIDYERDPSITPSVISAVETFSLFAKPWRAITRQTIDSRTQMSNELGLDPYSESVIAIQAQFANERHYDVLRKGLRLAQNNTATFDYAAAREHQDSSRAEVWRDLAYQLGLVSQKMAEDTMNHGVTHLYVTKTVAAQFLGMSPQYFQASGIAPRPGIYRLGRLFGQYDVYYTPKILKDTPQAAQILCVGRATDVTRNPIVLGDAVAPTVMPLAVGNDLRQGAGFYARNFTSVNPHDPSARGFALIDVTNMQ